MTMEECYQELGGNYAEVCKLLSNPSLIERFTARFLDDQSYCDLCKEIENGNRQAAFRSAHTLKGVCGNLSFTALFEKASALTESLRNNDSKISEEARVLFENVEQAYRNTVETIQAYIG